MTESEIKAQVNRFHARFRNLVCNEQGWPIGYFELACPSSTIDRVTKLILKHQDDLTILSKQTVEIISRVYYAGMIEGVRSYNKALKNGSIDFNKE